MLTVHRQDGNTLLLCPAHDQLPSHHQCFLIRERDILACIQSSHRRRQAGKPHQRGHDRIHLRKRSRRQQPCLPAEDFRPARIALPQPCRRSFIRKHCQRRLELRELFFQQRITGMRCQHRNMEQLRMRPDYIQCLRADGTRRTKNRYIFHPKSSSAGNMENLHKIINEWRREHHTIEAIQHPAMTRDQRTRILDARIPLHG